MLQYSRTLLENTIHGYTTVNMQTPRLLIQQMHWDYTLMPIWILTYKRGGKDYTYAMNGYTGKVWGRLPVCGKRLSILGVITGIAVGVLAGLLRYFLG